MFSPSYIKKCIMCREEIWRLVQQGRTPMTPGHLKAAKEVFRAGDAFHHPQTMKPTEYKIVTGVIPYTDLYADDPLIAYRLRECVILPTEQLLMAGVKASGWHLDEGAFGKGAEHLLDTIIESGRFKNSKTPR